MAYGNRFIQPGFAYHITQRGSNKQRVFLDESDYSVYLRFLRDNHQEAGVSILAYCLMTNHVHLIVRPEFEDSLSALFRRVQGHYARYINLKNGRSGHLWQNRYYSCVLSQTHLLRALRYVEHNPVRAQLTDKAGSYAWSSAAAHLGAPDPSQLLDLDFWRAEGGAETWQDLLATPEELNEQRRIRACTATGRPLGDETFLKMQETLANRNWQRKSFEEKLVTQAAA